MIGDLFVTLILIGVGVWFFRIGKSIGSRKGYGVGRSRGRRHRRW